MHYAFVLALKMHTRTPTQRKPLLCDVSHRTNVLLRKGAQPQNVTQKMYRMY